MSDHVQARPETGPMKFEGDWRGLFIRGDNCFYYAQWLRHCLQTFEGCEPFVRSVLEGLLGELEETNEHRFPDVDEQRMKPFTECAVIGPKPQGAI